MSRNSMRSYINRNRLYYYCLLGAAGGLTGWYLAAVFSTASVGKPTTPFQALQAGIVASTIALGVSAVEGIASGSLARFSRLGLAAAAGGLFGGAVSLAAAHALDFSASPSNSEPLFGSVVCWTLLGGTTGLAASVRSGSEAWKSLTGGLIGGAFAGVLFAVAGSDFSLVAQTPEQTFLSCLLATAGGVIGYSVAMATTLRRNAWLTVESGGDAGREIDVSRYVRLQRKGARHAVIGSRSDAAIYLSAAGGVLPVHAAIGNHEGQVFLQPLPEALAAGSTMWVNDRPVLTAAYLNNSDSLRIGEVALVYHQKRLSEARRSEASV
jgi:hypothetical protein